MEIERKFLVNSNWDPSIYVEQTHIRQAYLSSRENCVVRIRISETEAWLTIKGKGNISREEYEYEIPKLDAEAMWVSPMATSRIYKTRYRIGRWEVDVFHGLNDGLIVAEIELSDIDEEFYKPDWVGEEVSMDSRYSNVSLGSYPYSLWGGPTSL